MYVVRDIFYLKFGHFRDVKELMKEAKSKKLMPETQSTRVLTDFTGDSYRLVMEMEFPSLTEYEKSMSSGGGVNEQEWRSWYEKFKQHVRTSYREILKLETW